MVKQRNYHDNKPHPVASGDGKRRSLKRSSSDTSTLKRKRNSLKGEGIRAYNGLFTDDTSVWTSKLDNRSFYFLLKFVNFMRDGFLFLSFFRLVKY